MTESRRPGPDRRGRGRRSRPRPATAGRRGPTAATDRASRTVGRGARSPSTARRKPSRSLGTALVADRTRQLDQELEPRRRPGGDLVEHLRRGRPVEREVQLDQREAPAVVGQHLAGPRAGGVEAADPIGIGIAGSADPDKFIRIPKTKRRTKNREHGNEGQGGDWPFHSSFSCSLFFVLHSATDSPSPSSRPRPSCPSRAWSSAGSSRPFFQVATAAVLSPQAS